MSVPPPAADASSPPPADESPGSPAGRRLIFAGLAAFGVAFVVFLAIGPWLAPDDVAHSGHAVSEVAAPAPDGTFVVTLDVDDRDHWVPFDLGAGRLAPTIEESDIAARRYLLRAPHGAVDLGKVTLAAARVPPDAKWEMDREVDGALQNPALSSWYEYSYWTHRLEAQDRVHAVRRGDGTVAYVKVESYYCAPEGSGCLTLRYRLE